MSNNNPPFYVGQRVVCVKSNKHLGIKEGRIYVIHNIKKGCCGWDVGIGIRSFGVSSCPICLKEEPPSSIWWLMAYRFAPIEPRHQDVEIAEELLRQPVEERLDVKPVKNQLPCK